MNQLTAVALGETYGAVVQFLMSPELYKWLGRGFPYGTLLVNAVGFFLTGLLTEALVLQCDVITLEYLAGILDGFIGAFTTCSTFSGNFISDRAGQFNHSCFKYSNQCGCLSIDCMDRLALRQNFSSLFGWYYSLCAKWSLIR